MLDFDVDLQLRELGSQLEHLGLQLRWLLHFVLVPQEVQAFGLQQLVPDSQPEHLDLVLYLQGFFPSLAYYYKLLQPGS